MKRLWLTFLDLPLPTQAISLALTVFLLILVSGGVGSCVSHFKDRRFDKREAEREREREQLESERQKAIGRAEAAEARARELEEQRRVLEVTIEAQGERAERAQEAIANENEKLEQEIATVDADVDDCTRIIRLCERAKRLKIYPAAKPCDCL